MDVWFTNITFFSIPTPSPGTSALAQETWYSYKTGTWDDPDTWTTDPGGTTLAGTHTTENNNSYVILAGRTVTLTGKVPQTGLSLTINDGAIFELDEFKFQEELARLAGQGNVRTDASVTGISGGTAPFVNYYVNNTHTIEVHGNFTNNGTVEFTNQDHPVYNEFPTNGAASVFFRGNRNSSLICNDTTDSLKLVQVAARVMF